MRDNQEQERRSSAQAREQMMTLLKEEVGAIVAGAAQGDFSGRVNKSALDSELGRVG